MYLTEKEKKNLGKIFTPKEIEQLYLWNSLSFQKGIRFIIAWDKTDYNSFGEFLFVSGFYFGTLYTLWGLGIHEYRERKIMNWRVNSGNEIIYKDKPAISLQEVLKKIRQRRKEVARWLDPEQSEDGALFSTIADVSDEDSALSEISDLVEVG